MPAKRKTWAEKLANDNGLPKVSPMPEKLRTKWAGDTLVIPAPREVDALMKVVPRGKLVTIDELRKALACAHQADVACPITTGIFAWIAAHAAAEAGEIAGSLKKVTPYWRTLKARGELNPKYPGGIPELTRLLQAEGHKVVQKGKRYFVEGFEKKVASL